MFIDDTFSKQSGNQYLFSLKEQSSKIIQHRSSFGFWLARLFFFPERREILYLAYAYFRWLDDLLDQKDIPLDCAISTINRQAQIVINSYNGMCRYKSSYQQEDFIAAVISYDRQTGYLLKNMIFCFLRALDWDVHRKFHIVAQSQLDLYSFRLGTAYSDGLLFGLGLDPKNKLFAIPKTACSKASHLVHILRDVNDDLKLGYINISRSDLEKNDLDLKRPNPENWQSWAFSVNTRASLLFSIGRNESAKLPDVRSRIVFEWTCFRYLTTLKKLRKLWRNIETLSGIIDPIDFQLID